ncbi:MAG: hypothetical protein JJU11_08340 [Candidatus Sumerlaeia bacterium]|nr:hypothetical protein [Candidatus Sumerlaeia bacterium]
MTPSRITLSDLIAERNRALLETKSRFDCMKKRIDKIETDLEAFVVKHPVLALSGAVAAGAGIGALIPSGSLRRMATKSAALIITPLVSDMTDRVMRLFSGDKSSTD